MRFAAGLLGSLLCALNCAAQQPEASHEREVGVFYQPAPADAHGLSRLARGNPGGRAGFQRVLAPVLRTGEQERMVWREYLAAIAANGGPHLRAVLDLHVLASQRWLAAGRLEQLLTEILHSKHARRIGGFYVCDEPFGRSRPDRKNSLDLARVHALAARTRRVLKAARSRIPIYADYGSVFPLLRAGGDLVKGGWKDATEDPRERETFLWEGRFVRSVKVRASGRPHTFQRSYGAFGEDVTLVNWWEDARSLERWLPRILREVPARRLAFVLGYAWGPDTEAANAAWYEKTRALLAVIRKRRLRGVWFWPWNSIPAQGRLYKGVSRWWEDGPPGSPHTRRFASLIESLR